MRSMHSKARDGTGDVKIRTMDERIKMYVRKVTAAEEHKSLVRLASIYNSFDAVALGS